MTTLEEDVEEHFARMRRGVRYDNASDWMHVTRNVAAFDQVLFLFTHVLNEIANGPLYADYVTLSRQLRPEDTIITFNWDVLLDRALQESTNWIPDTGYGIRFSSMFDEAWRLPERPWSKGPTLLKLHGSTNWLRCHITRDVATGAWSILRTNTAVVAPGKEVEVVFRMEYDSNVLADRRLSSAPYTLSQLRPLCFVNGTRRFASFNDRFRPGYAPFTYFQSPLDPNYGAPTGPLIIAPVKHKAYGQYAIILEPLWARAADALRDARRIVIVGFSFPPTDLRARELFTPSDRRRSIEMVDPYPDQPVSTLRELLGSSDDIRQTAASFAEFLARSV